MVILIDQDGTIADFEGHFLKEWRARYPRRKFIPLAKRKNFYTADDYPKRYYDDVMAIFHTPGFFLNLPPIEGMQEAIVEMGKLGFEVFICTAPMTGAPHCLTEKYLWIEKYLGADFTGRLIITKDKTLVRGSYLIDDKPEITGSYEPIWKHVLYEAPYNRRVKDKLRLTWHIWRKILLEGPFPKGGG